MTFPGTLTLNHHDVSKQGSDPLQCLSLQTSPLQTETLQPNLSRRLSPGREKLDLTSELRAKYNIRSLALSFNLQSVCIDDLTLSDIFRSGEVGFGGSTRNEKDGGGMGISVIKG